MIDINNASVALRMRNKLRHLGADRRGIAAVEFALIVPLMLLLFFGTVEVSTGVAVDRKVTMAAQTMSDLTSRSTKVNDLEISNYRAIINAMLTPYSSTPLRATVTQLYIDPATEVARAQWSKGDQPYSRGAPVIIPKALIARDAAGKALPGQYLIFSNVEYRFVPFLGFVMLKEGILLNEIAYTRPRLSNCVFFGSEAACTTY